MFIFPIYFLENSYNLYMCTIIIASWNCLFLMSRSRIFYSYGDVTIKGEGLKCLRMHITWGPLRGRGPYCATPVVTCKGPRFSPQFSCLLRKARGTDDLFQLKLTFSINPNMFCSLSFKPFILWILKTTHKGLL